jgi:alpha-ketoglutarate-dependent 2,4-dichlorophenoxyacetate dioxygenase
MAIEVKRLHPLFAGEMTGIDLSHAIDEPTRQAVERALDEHAVIVLPGPQLDDEKQVAFTRVYGTTIIDVYATAVRCFRGPS